MNDPKYEYFIHNALMQYTYNVDDTEINITCITLNGDGYDNEFLARDGILCGGL